MADPKRPGWPPESDVELYGTDLVGFWQDAASEWHDWALHMESVYIRKENGYGDLLAEFKRQSARIYELECELERCREGVSG